jgi:O-antigen ligase
MFDEQIVVPLRPLIPSLSLSIGALALAGAWLQPNHYLPWPSFHMDTWVAVLLMTAALVVIVRAHGPVEWHGLSILALPLALVPLAQWTVGVVESAGHAGIASAYLGGLWLAMIIGARWERADPFVAADALFLALGVASLGSVLLQLHEWLELDGLMFLSMGGGPSRPMANVGQANQLGTLLLWGIVGGAWALWRKQLRPVSFVSYALVLLFGIALTDSRAAVVNGGVLIIAAFVWRKAWPWPRAPWIAVMLGAALLFFIYTAPFLKAALLPAGEPIATSGLMTRPTGQYRLQAYGMLIDAVRRQPWMGYGWGQNVMAHLAVANEHPPLRQIYTHAHNLVLDILIWCGLPIGIGIVFGLAVWGWSAFRKLHAPAELLLLMPLMVLGGHAMLEYPFEYGYFLWPAGLLIGVLHVRLGFRSWPWGAGAWLIAPWVGLALYAGVAMRDYAKVEDNYRAWRFEMARVGALPPAPPPELLVLPQLETMLWALRAPMSAASSNKDVDRFRRAFDAMPNVFSAFQYAKALAMTGRTTEAQLWQRRINTMVGEQSVEAMCEEWARQQKDHPQMAHVPWPCP